MSETKFTPGPWILEGNYSGWVLKSCRKLLGRVFIDYSESIRGESLANARLISAAPDLFLAAEEVLEAWISSNEIALLRSYEKLMLAIRKAKGEPDENDDVDKAEFKYVTEERDEARNLIADWNELYWTEDRSLVEKRMKLTLQSWEESGWKKS